MFKSFEIRWFSPEARNSGTLGFHTSSVLALMTDQSSNDGSGAAWRVGKQWETGLVVLSLALVRRTGSMGWCWAGMIVYIVIHVFIEYFTDGWTSLSQLAAVLFADFC